MASVSVYTNVEIDLRDIDTDDLKSELERRDMQPDTADERAVPQMFEALYIGDEARAMSILRSFVQDVTGRTLP
jgi:hypothetical protein